MTKAYTTLSHRVRQRYLSLAKFIMQSATSLMASDDGNIMMNELLSNTNSGESNIVLDGNFRQVMNGIAEAYNNNARGNRDERFFQSLRRRYR